MTLLPVLLPEGYVSKVSAGDKLAAGEVIAEKSQTGSSDKNLQIAKFFKIAPKNISKVLKKNLGDGVLEGDILALKKGAFGVGSKKFISEFSGTITIVDEETGEIAIRAVGGEENVQTIVSPVDGTVDICNNEKIVIKTDKDAVVAIDGLGKETEGELLYIDDFKDEKLTKEVDEKIILAKTIDKVSVFKAIGLDAKGIITQGLEGADFIDLTEKKIATPIMVVTEDDFKRLIKQNGKKIYLGGEDKSIVTL